MPMPRSSRRWYVVVWLLLGAFSALSVSADVHKTAHPLAPPVPGAEELFVKVLRSDDLFSYTGRQITTYWRTGRANDVEVYHQPTDNRRLYYLNPERQHGRLLVSDGRQQWEYDPRLRELRHRRLSPGALDDDDLLSYTLLRANYRLAVDPKPRVWADRKAYVVTIKRPAGRTMARRFWIDAGSGVILKREIYRDDGKLAVTVAFSDITYHPKLASGIFDLSALARTPGVHVIELPSSSETVLPLTTLTAQLSGAALAPAALAGYRLVGATAATLNDKPLLHLRYSDGLNLVSLFELRRTQRQRPTQVPAGMRPTQIGPYAAHLAHRDSLTTLNWDTSTLNVTLMGELGLGTLRTLALAAMRGH